MSGHAPRPPQSLRTSGEHDRQAVILVVERDPEVGQPIVEQLISDGYRARLVRTAGHARVVVGTCRPRLAILGDLEPARGTLDLLTEIRGSRRDDPWPQDLPAIVIGAQAREPDLLRAFELGADDFLPRPAGYLELRVRLRALLRRAERHPRARPARIGALTIDPGERTVTLHGRGVQLRRLEYELLAHLAREPRRVFARQELLRDVWGYRTPGRTRTLDSHASRLRRKLAGDGERRWVVNVRGVGYRLI